MRAEYPGMLVSRAHTGPAAMRRCVPSLTDSARPQANLQPSQAAQLLNDRVKRIAKAHLEIADWLQVRPPGPEPPFRPHR